MTKDDKRFAFTTIEEKQEAESSLSLKDLYSHAYDELALQQDKRDKIISLYLAICSFLLPISFSIENLKNIRGYLFIGIGVIGFMFCTIINRYRVYKEVYWLSCITITRLSRYNQQNYNRELVQGIFYDCLRKKGKRVLSCNGPRGFRWGKFGLLLINSAETTYYLLVCLVSSLFVGLGLFSALTPLALPVRIGIAVFAFLFFTLLHYGLYCRKLFDVYRVLIDGRESSFNGAFGKAWFLYIYED